MGAGKSLCLESPAHRPFIAKGLRRGGSPGCASCGSCCLAGSLGGRLLPSCLGKGRALRGLAGKRTRGVEGYCITYKSSFSALYLTRCSNSSERQRERAGGPVRVGEQREPSEPGERSRAPGAQGRERIRSERKASPPAQPPPPHPSRRPLPASDPQAPPHPRNFARCSKRAHSPGTYNTPARTRLFGRGDAL